MTPALNLPALCERLEELDRKATPGWHLSPRNRLHVLSSMDHPVCEFSNAYHRQVRNGAEGLDPELMIELRNALPTILPLLRSIAGGKGMPEEPGCVSLMREVNATRPRSFEVTEAGKEIVKYIDALRAAALAMAVQRDTAEQECARLREENARLTLITQDRAGQIEGLHTELSRAQGGAKGGKAGS